MNLRRFRCASTACKAQPRVLQTCLPTHYALKRIFASRHNAHSTSLVDFISLAIYLPIVHIASIVVAHLISLHGLNIDFRIGR